jgi:hypothetical protein
MINILALKKIRMNLIGKNQEMDDHSTRLTPCKGYTASHDHTITEKSRRQVVS